MPCLQGVKTCASSALIVVLERAWKWVQWFRSYVEVRCDGGKFELSQMVELEGIFGTVAHIQQDRSFATFWRFPSKQKTLRMEQMFNLRAKEFQSDRQSGHQEVVSAFVSNLRAGSQSIVCFTGFNQFRESFLSSVQFRVT